MEIVVYSSTGCEYCKKIKGDLANWGLAFEERNVTENEAFFEDLHAKGIYSVPVTFLGETPIIGYRPNAMKKKLDELGLLQAKEPGPEAALALSEETEAESVFTPLSADVLEPLYDLVVIGGGPAGSSAAVYAARSRLKTLVIDKSPTAGALALTHKIANYPGVLGEVSGLELLTLMRRQASQFGATFVRSNIMSLHMTGEVKTVTLPEGTVRTKSVFVAVGSRGRATKVPGEERFEGRGVSYCATCDAAFFQDRTVAVVGDNAEAAEDAIQLARFAREVHVFVPGKEWSQDAEFHPLEGLSHVHVHKGTVLKEVTGVDRLRGIVVRTTDKEREVLLDGVFIYLSGNRPGTDFLGDVIAKDDAGFVLVDEYLRTNVAGVFAGGDARRTPVKQAVVAAADGAIAAMAADKYVNNRTRVVAQYS
ncbi:MAG: FAD-dependent oxidoreductase [Firmicutes bacterium]|nr:FAD-dependent oxidoreductase [Bacillota bacterium]